jgi:transposase-like protein
VSTTKYPPNGKFSDYFPCGLPVLTVFFSLLFFGSVVDLLHFREFRFIEIVMDDLKNFFCRNKKCPQYGIRGGENVRVRTTYGSKNTRLLYCTHCLQTFSERQGTVFFRSSLPDETIVSIHEHVAEGNGMRKTSRLTKVHHQTVMWSMANGRSRTRSSWWKIRRDA